MSVSTTNHKYTHNQNSDNKVSYSIRTIRSSDSVRWLQKGIEDFKISNINSFLYGLMFVIAGGVAIWFTRSDPIMVMILVTSFYLLGPPVATGLYDMSRAISHGESPSLMHAVSVFGKNFKHLLGMSVLLGAVMLVWTVVSSLLVSVFFGDVNGISSLVAGEKAAPFLGVLLMGGIVLSLLASTVSFTFLPLLNNKRMGAITLLAILGFIMLAWVRAMILAINAFLDNSAIINSGWTAMTSDPQFLSFLSIFLVVGMLFAAFAFTISVIAVPMIIHKRVSVFTAVSTSIKAVKTNPLPMFRWAATIAVLISVGIGLFFVGLAIALPIIGHASWHAYKDIVEES